MNALFTQLLKPFAPMAQDHIEPEQLMDSQGQQHSSGICEACNGTEVINFQPCPFCQQAIAPHIAKIPLRAEVRNLNMAAEAYEANARRHDEEAERLRELAKQAREQSDNLTRMANL